MRSGLMKSSEPHSIRKYLNVVPLLCPGMVNISLSMERSTRLFNLLKVLHSMFTKDGSETKGRLGLEDPGPSGCATTILEYLVREFRNALLFDLYTKGTDRFLIAK